jgi:hypothetical protein
MRAALKHMYGISLLDDGDFISGSSLLDFTNLASAADYYEIPGLLELSLEAASRALTPCLDDSGMLHTFLYAPMGHHSIVSVSPIHTSFVLRFYTENIAKLGDKEVFLTLLSWNEDLTKALFSSLAKKVGQLEERQ